MELMLNLTFIVMLTIAKGHIKKQTKKYKKFSCIKKLKNTKGNYRDIVPFF